MSDQDSIIPVIIDKKLKKERVNRKCDGDYVKAGFHWMCTPLDSKVLCSVRCLSQVVV